MFDQFGGFLVGLGSFVAVLSLVVFVHEFGHFQVARWFKVKVDSFSIGFGPEILGWTSKAGIRWRISGLPLGGYVKFAGDKDVASTPDFEQAKGDKSSGFLQDQPVGVRAAVAAAGPMFNFGFSILIFALFFGFMGEFVQRPLISEVLPAGAAAKAGVKAGDVVVEINGERIDDFADLQIATVVSGGKEMDLVVQRGTQEISLKATPDIVEKTTPFGDKETQGQLGLVTLQSRDSIEHRRYNPIQALGRGVEQTGSIITTQVKFIGALLRGGMSAGHLSGPLGIGQMAGKVTQNNIEAAGTDATALKVAESVGLGLVKLAAVISVAIGFMNLLPLPMLDGGHLVFYAAEAIRGRPVSEKIQVASLKVGVACVLSLFIFATIQDLDRAGLFNALKGIGAAG